MGIFDNKVHLALVAVVGFAIIGMIVVVPSFAADAQENSDITPVQFPGPSTGIPEETPEETPEEDPFGAPAPEDDLTTPEEPEPFGAPAEEPGLLPEPEAGLTTPEATPEETTPAPGEDLFGTPSESPEAPESGLTPEEAAPEESSPFGAPEESETEPTEAITPTQFPLPEEEPTTPEEDPFGTPAPEEEPLPAPEGAEPFGAPEEATPEPFGAPGIEEPAPEEEAPELEPFATPSPAPEDDLTTPEEPMPFGVPEEDMTEEEAMPERTMDEGFFNAVKFSPAEGSWAVISIEGTGLEAQNMSVTQSMEGPDRFRVSIELTLSSETAVFDAGTGATGEAIEMPPTSSATVTLNPASTSAGSSVTVQGTEFEANQPVTITIGGTPVQTAGMSTDAEGSLSGEFTVPTSIESGVHTLAVRDAAGHTAVTTINIDGEAAGEVTETVPPEATPATPAVPATPAEPAIPPTPEEITPPEEEAPVPEETTVAPVLTLDVTSGVTGSAVNVDGTGFEANSDITLTFDGTDMGAGPVTTDATGAFTATVTVAADATEGVHDITAQDTAGNSASASFTVEAAAEITTTPPTEATPTVP